MFDRVLLVLFSVLSLSVAVRAGVDRAPQVRSAFCESVNNELPNRSAAALFCASRKATSSTVTKTKTVTKFQTTTSTTTPLSTATSEVTYTVLSGSTTKTTTITTTSILVNPSYSCISSGTASVSPAIFAQDKSPFPSTWSEEMVSTACDCLSTTPSAQTVTKVVTSTVTKRRTRTVTGKSTSTVYATSTLTVTSPSVILKTQTVTTTATAGPNQQFRVTVDYPQASPSQLYLQPAIAEEDIQFIYAYPLGHYSSGSHWELTDACNFYNTHVGLYGSQSNSEENPGLVFLTGTSPIGGKPITCGIDLAESEVHCSSPNGGSDTFLCQEMVSGGEYYLLYLGKDDPGSSCGEVTLRAIFE